MSKPDSYYKELDKQYNGSVNDFCETVRSRYYIDKYTFIWGRLNPFSKTFECENGAIISLGGVR